MRISFLFLTILLFSLSACQKESETIIPFEDEQAANLRSQPLQDQVDITIIAGLTVDDEGNTVIPVAADPATLLYYSRTDLPILAPDGHHVTAGEFAAAKGTAEAKCLQPGTQVKLKLSGLLPNATYRAWVLTFKFPGFNPMLLPHPFVNLIGEGALGPDDRSRNTFRSSASGQGTIVRFIPEGDLSEFGDVGNCLLSDVYEWHVVGALQQPGEPGGTEVGPPVFFPTSAVEQFVFVFK